jgi:hypothetical protein
MTVFEAVAPLNRIEPQARPAGVLERMILGRQRRAEPAAVLTASAARP